MSPVSVVFAVLPRHQRDLCATARGRSLTDGKGLPQVTRPAIAPPKIIISATYRPGTKLPVNKEEVAINK